MSSNDLQSVKEELIKAGLEIYRTRPAELEIAERVRLHIMDSGIRVLENLSVTFTARTQRSDFPSVAPEQLFARVREIVGQDALGRGYVENDVRTIDVKDPMDDARTLDVWHEVSYSIEAGSVEIVVEEVRWALTIEKYVGP